MSDNEVVPSPMDSPVDSPIDSPIGSPMDSPYNPEFASPFDIRTPGLDNDINDVDFKAFKDVVAFDDIMKSKVKQHARKHKRKKLEEMKFDPTGNRSKKEVRINIYGIFFLLNLFYFVFQWNSRVFNGP